jgi:hypothetical protein
MVNGMSFVTKYFDRTARTNLLVELHVWRREDRWSIHIGRKRNIYWQPSLSYLSSFLRPRDLIPPLFRPIPDCRSYYIWPKEFVQIVSQRIILGTPRDDIGTTRVFYIFESWP